MSDRQHTGDQVVHTLAGPMSEVPPTVAGRTDPWWLPPSVRRKLDDPDWLADRYLTQGLTGPQIASELGVSLGPVTNALNRFRRRRCDHEAQGSPEPGELPWLEERLFAGTTVPEMAAEAHVSEAQVLSWLHDRWKLADPAVYAYLGDPEWLYDRYVADGLTMKQIGAEIGVSHHTVAKYLRRAGIEVPDVNVERARLAPQAWPAVLRDRAWLVEQYVTRRLSVDRVVEAATEHSGQPITQWLVYAALQRAGIPIRKGLRRWHPDDVAATLKDRDRLAAHLRRFRATNDAAADLGVGKATYVRWTRRHGLIVDRKRVPEATYDGE